MTTLSYVEIGLLAFACLCFYWAWHIPIPAPYGGDARLSKMICKLVGYGLVAVLLGIVFVLLIIQHVQFK